MEALSWPGTSSASSTLRGVGLRNGGNLKCVHAHLWIVDFELGKSGVYYVHDAIHCQTSLCNVGSHNDLAYTWCCSVEDLCLQISRHLTVDGENAKFWRIVEKLEPFSYKLTCDFNVFLARHENEDVARSLGDMYGKNLFDRSVDIVVAWRSRILNVNGECSPWNYKFGSSSVEAREAF